MRILLFTSSYAPVTGGVQTVVRNLAKQLLRQGHEIRVVTNRYPVDLPARETIDDVRVDRLLLLRPQLDQLRRGRLDLFTASFYFAASNHWQLNRLVKEFRPQVVNVHFPEHQIDSVLRLRRQIDFRLIVSLHGHDVLRFVNGNGPQNGHRAASLRRLTTLLQSADAVTAVSENLLGEALQLEPAIRTKAQVIPNGVEVERFAAAAAYQHQRSYILAVGRLVQAKGLDLLIEAFARLKARPDLIIAGSGEEFAALQQQVRGLGLADSVHFFGQASRDEVAELIAGSLCVVIPSRSESFGIVALEALAASKPVVATKTGGLEELLKHLSRVRREDTANSFNIMLVEPNVAGLTEGLQTVLTQKITVPQQPPAVPEEFSWRAVAARYEELLGQGNQKGQFA
jgi:glycosyltransferase involved in cell wall biosynthesis